MKRIILLLSFVCCSQSIFSQVPGYMGKRVSVSYQNTIFPDITGRDSKAIINSSQNVEINYIKKHSALCFTFMYFPIKLNTSFNSGYSYDYTFPDKVDYIKFNSFTYCIGLKLFLNR